MFASRAFLRSCCSSGRGRIYNRLKVSIGRKKQSQNRNPETLFSSEDTERNAQTYRAAAGSFGHFEKYTYQLSSVRVI